MSNRMQATVGYGMIAGLLITLYYPAMAWLARSWVVNPYYTHGFLVPPISVLLAWRQWHIVRNTPPARGPTLDRVSALGFILTTASLGAVVWAMRWQNYVVVSFTLVAMLLGILLFLEGWARVRRWLFPLLFLCFMVPLPFIDLASPWMETFAADSATSLAQLFGIAASHQGGEITLPALTLVVGAPCSGLRSLVAMVTVSVGWVYVVEGRLAAKTAMVIVIIPLVMLSNVLRILVLLLVAVYFGETAALTYYHDWSSPILFLVSLGLLLVLGKVLGCSKVREDIF